MHALFYFTDPKNAIPAVDTCNAGPHAFDLEDGNLTQRVLACPPPECLPFGCPGHELYVKRLAGCGVDTENAAVGTSFAINFTVFDFHHPPAYTSILLTITVAAPCPAGHFYCPDALNVTRCSSIPCYLLNPVVQDVPLEPPDIYLDLNNVPEGSVELVSPLPGSLEVVGGLVRPSAIRIWGVCGWSLPVNLTAVCGARPADSCAENSAQCPLRVRKVNAANSATIVSFASNPESTSGCALDLLQQELNSEYSVNETLSDRQCVGCSAELAMQGQCEPTRHSMTMHGVGALTGEQGAAMAAEIVITPAIADAQIRAQVAITAASHADLQVLIHGWKR